MCGARFRLTTASTAVLLTACATWPVGGDPNGVSLRPRIEQVAAAARHFFDARGSWPRSVDELVPAFIQRLPDAQVSISAKGADAVISFVYAPSWPSIGQVSCASSIRKIDWSCQGYV
jgi:hypothetical protein